MIKKKGVSADTKDLRAKKQKSSKERTFQCDSMILQGFRNESFTKARQSYGKGQTMKKTEKSVAWCAVFVLWNFGALLLLKIWNFQKLLPDPLDPYIELSIIVLATFYILVILFIKHCVDCCLWRFGLFEDTNKSLRIGGA
jgi:hypothetical protein